MNLYSLAGHLGAGTLVVSGSLVLSGASLADQIEHEDIASVWSRLDQPVMSGRTARTWWWGPEPITPLHAEPYLDAPGGERLVIYFDKTRMELNSDAEPGSAWRVTNGLLATELITGQVQLGNETFATAAAPEINVAGDPDDERGPTYRSLNMVIDTGARAEGSLITETISRSGTVTAEPAYGDYQVTASHYLEKTNHTVASVFWDYITANGIIYQDGDYLDGPLFEHHLYGVGYPLTEAYWTTVRVAGVDQPVLVQAFQRRVLTYTPNNPDGWKVEAGNVGRHYRDWRAALGDLEEADDQPATTEAGPDSDDATGNEEADENPATGDCEQHSVNEGQAGSVEQSNTSTVTQNGGGKSVTCEQENVMVVP